MKTKSPRQIGLKVDFALTRTKIDVTIFIKKVDNRIELHLPHKPPIRLFHEPMAQPDR